MYTARRTEEFGSDLLNKESNVCVLERKVPQDYDEYVNGSSYDEEIDEARARMQKNLDKILNYEKYANEETDSLQTNQVEEVLSEEIKSEAVSYSDEDITPSSTTMQFGNEDAQNVYNDMEKSKEEKKASYHLNFKGKLVVAFYSLVVIAVLALIVLNTGVLATLAERNSEYTDTLNTKQQEYNEIVEQLEDISSSDYISNIAENDFGMQK